MILKFFFNYIRSVSERVKKLFSKKQFVLAFATLNIKNMLCLVVIGFTLLLLLTTISLVTWPEIECVLLSQVKGLQQLFANTFCLPAPEVTVTIEKTYNAAELSTETLQSVKKSNEWKLASVQEGGIYAVGTGIVLTIMAYIVVPGGPALTIFVPIITIVNGAWQKNSALVAVDSIKNIDNELLARSAQSEKTADMLSEQVASGNSVFLQSIFDFCLTNYVCMLLISFLVFFLIRTYFYFKS